MPGNLCYAQIGSDIDAQGGAVVFRRNILVPLDGSDFSRQIVPHLCRLCDPAKDTMILLRVAEPVESIIGAPPKAVSMAWMEPLHTSAWDIEYSQHPIYASQLEQNERSMLEQELLLDRQMLKAAGFSVSFDIRFGDPAEEIATVVQQRSVDLVAMATHGRTGLRHILMGSVAQQVVRRVNVPVLLVRPFQAEEH
jgi:nucleotide-binding universal stress UspA family protein